MLPAARPATTPAGSGWAISIRESLDSLLANKGRALLTMLGVIIGVASVVALLALGNGATGVDHRPDREHRHQPHLRHARARAANAARVGRQ